MPELVRAALRAATEAHQNQQGDHHNNNDNDDSSSRSNSHNSNNNNNNHNNHHHNNSRGGSASEGGGGSGSGGKCPYAAAWSTSQPTTTTTTTTMTTTTTEKEETTTNINNNNNNNNTSSSSSSSSNNNDNDNDDDIAVWELARTSCPAFSQSCPFAKAQTATDVRQTLLQLPTSHWQASYFYQALQHLHNVVGGRGEGGGERGEGGMLEEEGKDHNRSSNSSSSHVRGEDSSSSSSHHHHRHHHDESMAMTDDSERSYRIPGGCPMKQYTTPLIQEQLRKSSSTTTTTSSFSSSFGQAMEECSLAAIMARMAKELEEEEQEGKGDGSSTANLMATTNRNKEKDDENVISDEPNVVVASSVSLVDSPQEPFQSDDNNNIESMILPPPPPIGTPSLALALKTGTAASHEAAEHVHFVRNFIRGTIDRDLYAQLVLSLFHVYKTLEDLLHEHATPAHFDTLHFPQQLNRTASLEEDVDFWWNTKSMNNNSMTPATRDYVRRLQQIAKDDPVLLVAHAYTRYLGDLSGGRILARVAKKALHLEDDNDDNDEDDEHRRRRHYTEGLAFYHFEHVPNPKQFKDTYRLALDQLPLLKSQATSNSSSKDIDDNGDKDVDINCMIEKLVLEANVAFLLNMRLFEELDVMANVPGAQVRPMKEALEQAAVAMKTSTASTNRGQGGNGKDKKKMNTTTTTLGEGANSVATTGAAAANSTATCPFAYMGKERPSTTAMMLHSKPKAPTMVSSAVISSNDSSSSSKRCPWPFVFFHDPIQGMKDWQTWCVVGVILAWLWTIV